MSRCRAVSVTAGIRLGDLRRNGGWVVPRQDVVRRLDASRAGPVSVRRRSGKGNAQLGVTAKADSAAEPDDRGGGSVTGRSQFGDGLHGGAERVCEHLVCYPLFDGCEVRKQRADSDEDVVSGIRAARFGSGRTALVVLSALADRAAGSRHRCLQVSGCPP